MTMYGADVAHLDALAKSLDRSSDALQQMAREVGSSYAADIWRGPDAQRARSNWESVLRPQLAAVANSLFQCGETLRRNAHEQREASGSGTGSVSGALPGLGAVPTGPGHASQPGFWGTGGLFESLKASWGLLDVAGDFADKSTAVGRRLTGPFMKGSFLFAGGISVGFDLAGFINADGNDRIGAGVDLIASSLKVAPNPIAKLAGVGLSTGKVITEEWGKVDFSPSGLKLAFDEIKRDPGALVDDLFTSATNVFGRIL